VTTRRRSGVDVAAMLRLIDLTDYIVPHTIRSIAELGVADQLTAGPRPVEQIAKAVEADPVALLRALRALACNGVFTEGPEGTFGLTPLAELLRADHPYSMRANLAIDPAQLYAWADYHETMRTGAPAYPRVHGRPYPGGAGATDRVEREALATVFPADGIVTVEATGDVPPGADTYLLHRTLWTLPDSAAVELLARVRAALPVTGRVLVFEPVHTPGEAPGLAALHDLFLLVFTGGKVRTHAELAELFAAADLRCAATYPTTFFPIVEAVPCEAARAEGIPCR